MPREDYQVLLNEMQQYQSNSQEYAPFLTAMQQLNQEMEGLMEPDENGWKLITPERMDSLAGKYRTAGRALEKYLQGTKNTSRNDSCIFIAWELYNSYSGANRKMNDICMCNFNIKKIFN